MDSDRILLAALIFLAVVVGSNLLMFGIVRGWAKGDSRWLSALKDSFNKPVNQNPASQSMDELRQRVQELEKKKTDD
jgi:hypothetical protein